MYDSLAIVLHSYQLNCPFNVLKLEFSVNRYSARKKLMQYSAYFFTICSIMLEKSTIAAVMTDTMLVQSKHVCIVSVIGEVLDAEKREKHCERAHCDSLSSCGHQF